jgi:3-carboxy-cis,cis-muconate cycloisomerase
MSDELPTAARVSDPGIRALYRLENRWQAWLDVEAALAKAQAELGIIPTGAADAIGRAARLELLDRARIDEGFARTGHTIVPLVWELSRVTGEPHGGWVHWGATTQNITQTGDLLVLRQTHRILLGLIGEALSAMADLAERGSRSPCRPAPSAARRCRRSATPSYARTSSPPRPRFAPAFPWLWKRCRPSTRPTARQA